MNGPKPTRRGLLMAAGLFPIAGAARGSGGQRMVALDWGLASTLIALGAPPVGIAEPALYRGWVGEPALPDGIRDVGLRLEPNLECLAELAPDRILIGPLSEAARPILERVAPVSQLAVFTHERDPLRRLDAVTRDLGVMAGREQAATALLARHEAAFAEASIRVATRARRALVVLSFLDSRHVHVHGAGSLFDAVLRRIGLANAWQGSTSVWGTATVALESLADLPESAIVVVDPTPATVASSLAQPGLWASLPQVRAGRIMRLPPCWAFGDVVAAGRFAALLLNRLDQPAG